MYEAKMFNSVQAHILVLLQWLYTEVGELGGEFGCFFFFLKRSLIYG